MFLASGRRYIIWSGGAFSRINQRFCFSKHAQWLRRVTDLEGGLSRDTSVVLASFWLQNSISEEWGEMI